MDKIEQFDFLKNYYNLLKNKNAHGIGNRFLTQVKQLAALGEIDAQVLNIVTSCVTIGLKTKQDLSDEDFEIIKDFINIGSEIQEEEDANQLAITLAANYQFSQVHSTSQNIQGPQLKSYSGKLNGGC